MWCSRRFLHFGWGFSIFDAVETEVGNAMEKEELEESLPVPFQLQIDQSRLGI